MQNSGELRAGQYSAETEFLKEHSHALTGPADFDALISAIGDARIVMMGEAISRYSRVLCMESHPFPKAYREGIGYAGSSLLVPRACTQEVVDLLSEIRSKLSQYNTDHETVFSTEQNALVAYHAEKYYRAMLMAEIRHGTFVTLI